MLATRRNQYITASILIVVVAILLGIYANSALARSNTSTADVYWSWDTSNQVGTSNLVRNKNGISAEYSTDGLPGGQAMTLWFIVFNYPEDCGGAGCGLADMGANRPAQGDFLLASGHVIDADGTATFGGSLKVGDIGGSGLAEFEGGCIPDPNLPPDCGGPVGLVNVEGALVVLALHSHGPKLTGQELESQISSFLGGCESFIGTGPDGFAANAGQIPANVGECSTFQISPHPPN